LVEFLKSKPEYEMTWHPCEIGLLNPNYKESKYGDMCIQGMFFAIDNGIDIWKYHNKLYSIVHKEDINVNDVDTLLKALDSLLDTVALRKALEDGVYRNKLKDANKFAFDKTGIHVVPTYRADGGFLQDRQEFFNMGFSDTAYNSTK